MQIIGLESSLQPSYEVSYVDPIYVSLDGLVIHQEYLTEQRTWSEDVINENFSYFKGLETV